MNCPRCETAQLAEIDREGITIDRCDRCRGIWLDRGELEKLTARGRPGGRDDDDDRRRGRDDRDDRRRRDDDDDDDDRRGGFWSNLFD